MPLRVAELYNVVNKTIVMEKVKVILLLFIFTLPVVASSQSRMLIKGVEFTGAFGLTYFSGDLGGGKKNYVNLQMQTLNFAFGGGIRYFISNRFAVRGNIYYGRLSSDDAVSGDRYRRARNLNFRSDIADFSFQLEYSIINWNVKENNKKLYRRIINDKHNIYVFTGLSFFRFHPYGEYSGQWYSLPELSTSGQGLPGGPAPYKLSSFSIPMGVGYKYLIGKKYSIGFEIVFRKTFTDYIDDVSGPYYDNDLLRQHKGDLAADIADKNIGREGIKFPAGATRGNPNMNDNFAFILITINKRLNLFRSGKKDIPCAYE